jgi:hypothetical protein
LQVPASEHLSGGVLQSPSDVQATGAASGEPLFDPPEAASISPGPWQRRSSPQVSPGGQEPSRSHAALFLNLGL